MPRALTISLLALFAMATMAATARDEDKKSSALEVGEVVADQSLTTTDGKTFKLSELRNDKKGKGGKIVLVTFWSYKCPTGKRMMEANKEIAEYCKENDVVFLAVSSYGESKDQVKKYCEDKDVEYSVAYDADQSVTQALGARFVSTTLILDRDGKLAYMGSLVSRRKNKETGEQTPHARNALEELVAGKKVTTPETATYG